MRNALELKREPERPRRALARCRILILGTLLAFPCCHAHPRAFAWPAVDLEGRAASLLAEEEARAIVLLFVAVDCPISNLYAPELVRIHSEYGKQGISFFRIYTDPDLEVAEIHRHTADFGYHMPARTDFDHELVREAEVQVVPTAVLLAPTGEMLYRGRIDDRFVDFGKQRPEPTRRDLRLALDSVLAGGKPEVASTEAVGCFLVDLLPEDEI